MHIGVEEHDIVVKVDLEYGFKLANCPANMRT